MSPHTRRYRCPVSVMDTILTSLSSYDTRLLTRLSPSLLPAPSLTGSTIPLWQSQVEDTIQEDGETTETGTTCATLKYDMVCSLVPGDPGYTVSGQQHTLVRAGIPSASTRFSDV